MSRVIALAPTITTNDPHEYREQMELISSYADGVHLDFADGIFAPTKMLDVDQSWRKDDIITHAHVMHKDPLRVVADLIKLDADLVILHAESDNLKQALTKLNDNGTRCGVAILPDTSVDDLRALEVDDLFEHVLVFGGRLGYQGGSADLTILDKVTELKQKYPDVEIGWDGGLNGDNAKQIAAAGVNVLNMGGYFKNAENPAKLYEELKKVLN